MEEYKLSRLQMTTVVVLRVLIGWHFLYEGIAKISKPGWSAAGFLLQSRGVLSGIFRWMASDPNVLAFVNPLNMWGLTLIGLGLDPRLLHPARRRLRASSSSSCSTCAIPPSWATSTRSPRKGAT